MKTTFTKFIEALEISELDKDQPWGKFVPDTVSGADIKDQARHFYQTKVKPHADKNIEKFAELLDISKTSGAEVKTSIKKQSSFVDKVVNRNKDSLRIHDIIRGAILVDKVEDVKKVLDNLQKYGHITELDIKRKGDNELGYHGSAHCSVKIDKVHCEVQIMPKKVWAAKNQTYKFYKKYRSKDEHDIQRQRSVDKAKEIFSKAVSELE